MKEKNPPKPDRAALLAAMKKQTPPPQGELARLAAIVFAACSAKEVEVKAPRSFPRDVSREEESVRVAARLWLHAGEYSKKLKFATEGTDYSKAWSVAGDDREASSEQMMAEWDDPSETALIPESALAWIRENATADKDRSITLAALKMAMKEFGLPSTLIPIQRLREFLKWRTKQRSAEHAARKRISSAGEK